MATFLSVAAFLSTTTTIDQLLLQKWRTGIPNRWGNGPRLFKNSGSLVLLDLKLRMQTLIWEIEIEGALEAGLVILGGGLNWFC